MLISCFLLKSACACEKESDICHCLGMQAADLSTSKGFEQSLADFRTYAIKT